MELAISVQRARLYPKGASLSGGYVSIGRASTLSWDGQRRGRCAVPLRVAGRNVSIVVHVPSHVPTYAGS